MTKCIPLWTYSKVTLQNGFNVGITSVGKAFIDKFGYEIKVLCWDTVGAKTNKEWLNRDNTASHNVTTSVMERLWLTNDIRIPFLRSLAIPAHIAEVKLAIERYKIGAEIFNNPVHKEHHKRQADSYGDVLFYLESL